MYFDIHCHLDHPLLNAAQAVNNAKIAGLSHIFTVGINPETNRKTMDLAKQYDIVKACLGIYPLEPLQVEAQEESYPETKPFNIDEEIAWMKKQEFSLVGEVGLDYASIKDKNKEQKELFQKMIELAEKLKKPIVIHSRKAEQDCIDMLSSSKLKKVVMHCFCGKKSQVKSIVDKGWFLSIPPIIMRATQFQQNVDLAPITQLLTETDAPYLGPTKEEVNEPKNVVVTVKKIAEIKGMEAEEVKRNLYMNLQRLL